MVLQVIGMGLISAVSLSTTAAPVLPLESQLGGLAHYDPNLDITWATDANTNCANIRSGQLDWAASLTIAGISGWRLPSAGVNGDRVVVNCSVGGVSDCDHNGMGYLFWEEGVPVLHQVNSVIFSLVQVASIAPVQMQAAS